MSEKTREEASELDSVIEREKKKRRQDYYVDAFRKLEETGEHTWNWTACLGEVFWLFYRKMYLYGSCLTFAHIFLNMISIVMFKNRFIYAVLAVWVILRAVLGFFGNALYYRVVKERIKDGYHLLDRYKHTSRAMVWCSLFGTLVSVCSCLMFAWADLIAREKYFKTHKLRDNKINEKNIRRYLTDSFNDHKEGVIAKITAACFIIIILGVSAVQSSEYIHETRKSFQKYLRSDY